MNGFNTFSDVTGGEHIELTPKQLGQLMTDDDYAINQVGCEVLPDALYCFREQVKYLMKWAQEKGYCEDELRDIDVTLSHLVPLEHDDLDAINRYVKEGDNSG